MSAVPRSVVSNEADTSAQPTLSARFVSYVRDYYLDRGIDPTKLFVRCELDVESSEEGDRPLAASQVALLLEEAARDSGDLTFGLQMARSYHYEASSLLILAVVSAPSVAEGIRCLRHYDRFVDTAIETGFDFDQNRAEFSLHVITPGDVATRQLSEYLCAFLVQALSNATRKPMPIMEVHFRHREACNRAALEEFFSAPVLFGEAENLIAFDSAYLKERFYTSHSLLHEVLTQALRTYFVSPWSGQCFVDTLCRELTRASSTDAVTLERVAKKMAMSPRTLRRRLSGEGRSFQEIKKMAWEKRAKYYLSYTSMPLSEIAFKLGYSELSAFSRAFRSWEGETPQAYRQNTNAQAALDK